MNSLHSHNPLVNFIHELRAPLLWLVVLVTVYSLHDFFLVIFLTFILTYSMRSATVLLLSKIFRKKEHPRWAEMTTVVLCFSLFLASLYCIGSYIGPQLVDQGQSLVKRFTRSEATDSKFVDRLLARTIGEYLFRQKFGDKSSSSYQAAFNQFRDPERAAGEFERILKEVEEAFDASLQSNTLISEVLVFSLAPSDEADFRDWVLKEKSPIIMETHGIRYRQEWENHYRQQEFQLEGIKPFADLSQEEITDSLLRFITNSILEDDALRIELIREWRKTVVHTKARQLKVEQPEEYREKFKSFYKSYHAGHRSSLPYSYQDFVKLLNARQVSSSAFAQTLMDSYPTLETSNNSDAERARSAFEHAERLRLMEDWKSGEIAAKLQKIFEEQVLHAMKMAGEYLGEALPALLALPVQLTLALLLSFLISIDVPRISRGMEKIRRSRARWIYDELAPTMISFGKLIGRAFQAQGIIAIANSVLTLIAIQLLGIENAAFLCGIVFVCSFIPVLGVVLSSVPIAIMAIVQDGGGLMLALSAIAAILLVHFIETSLLNPKILGDMLHLHPVMVLAVLAISEHFAGVWGLLLGVPVIVYIIRFLILNEGIPGFIEPIPPETDIEDVLS
jgi:predicted PurR-regulated permease PerM